MGQPYSRGDRALLSRAPLARGADAEIDAAGTPIRINAPTSTT
jgi:hypothetical protein